MPMLLNDTPLANDRIDATQGPIRTNFQNIDTAFQVNHVGYTLSGQGKHKFLQMPEQSSAPTTDANEAGLYAAVGATSMVSELVFRRESNGTSIAFTEGTLSSDGWTRLPSGLVVKWGAVTTDASANKTVVLTQGPAFTTIYAAFGTTETVGVTTQTSTVNITISNPNTIIIRAYAIVENSMVPGQTTVTQAAKSICYLVIGV